jgi:hypothetical protein
LLPTCGAIDLFKTEYKLSQILLVIEMGVLLQNFAQSSGNKNETAQTQVKTTNSTNMKT